MAALSLSAVARLGRVGGVALSADLLAIHSLLDERNKGRVHLSVARTTSESKHQVQSRLLLDVVVRESAAVLKLLAGEDETLLVWWDTLLVYIVVLAMRCC